MSYTDYLLIVTSTITGCVSISAFASLIGIAIGITSSAIGLKIRATTAVIKKYKSIKKKKKYDNIVLLAKSKLNSIKVLISKALIDSNISHDEFVFINNVLKEFYDMKDGFYVLLAFLLITSVLLMAASIYCYKRSF